VHRRDRGGSASCTRPAREGGEKLSSLTTVKGGGVLGPGAAGEKKGDPPVHRRRESVCDREDKESADQMLISVSKEEKSPSTPERVRGGRGVGCGL